MNSVIGFSLNDCISHQWVPINGGHDRLCDLIESWPVRFFVVKNVKLLAASYFIREPNTKCVWKFAIHSGWIYFYHWIKLALGLSRVLCDCSVFCQTFPGLLLVGWLVGWFCFTICLIPCYVTSCWTNQAFKEERERWGGEGWWRGRWSVFTTCRELTMASVKLQ